MTLIINFVGAFVIGIAAQMAEQTELLSANTVLFVKTKVCGGFTTFSIFSLETVTLLEGATDCRPQLNS